MFYYAIKEMRVYPRNQLFRACFKRAEECGERNVLLHCLEGCSTLFCIIFDIFGLLVCKCLLIIKYVGLLVSQQILFIYIVC